MVHVQLSGASEFTGGGTILLRVPMTDLERVPIHSSVALSVLGVQPPIRRRSEAVYTQRHRAARAVGRLLRSKDGTRDPQGGLVAAV